MARSHPRRFPALIVALLWLPGCASLPIKPPVAPSPAPTAGVQTDDARQHAAYWIARLQAPDALLLDGAAIEARNRRLLALDPTLQDLATLPAHVDGAKVGDAIAALSRLPDRPLFDALGQPVTPPTRRAWQDALALDAIPATVEVRHGLVTHRADLRTFPTATRVFRQAIDDGIDRFQESALFPGTPVRVLHPSRDGEWLFVQSARYSAWMRSDRLAIGEEARVFAHAGHVPALWVTGARADTVESTEAPALSRVTMDMGTRIAHLPDWPRDQPVNGRLPGRSQVVLLPVRQDDGGLRLAPALLEPDADVSPAPLPLTPRRLLAQSFKFLGEPYGWGHADGARDCSGFVSEIHAAFGMLLPRNTGDQLRSPAIATETLPADASPATRAALLASLGPGDLVHIPGHVMMVIGHEGGQTWVIHDTPAVRMEGTSPGAPRSGVVVTPLEALRTAEGKAYDALILGVQRLAAPVASATASTGH